MRSEENGKGFEDHERGKRGKGSLQSHVRGCKSKGKVGE